MKRRVEAMLGRAKMVARELYEEPDDLSRTNSFAAFKTLIDILRDINKNWNHDNSYAREKLLGAMEHATAIAGLAPKMGHDDESHYSWLLGELDSAGSNLALGAIPD